MCECLIVWQCQGCETVCWLSSFAWCKVDLRSVYICRLSCFQSHFPSPLQNFVMWLRFLELLVLVTFLLLSWESCAIPTDLVKSSLATFCFVLFCFNHTEFSALSCKCCLRENLQYKIWSLLIMFPAFCRKRLPGYLLSPSKNNFCYHQIDTFAWPTEIPMTIVNAKPCELKLRSKKSSGKARGWVLIWWCVE